MKTTFKTLATAALAATSALALTAGAASAQPRYYDGGRDNGRYDQRYDQGYGQRYDGRDAQSINARQRNVERRIERGLQRGTITRSEANRLIREFRQLAYLEARYRQNGISGWERADLDRRFDRLEAQVRIENRDRDMGYGYGRR